MPSNYSASLRIELQTTGENINVWGAKLDTAIERLDTAIAGLQTLALTGNYTLTTSNTASDDSRAAMLKFTGGAGPFTVTIPSVSKVYKVWNATTGPVTLTTGSGSTIQIDTTDIVEVFCDGTNVKTIGFGGVSLKSYIASVVVGGGATLPSVVAQSGKWLTNNGSIAQWAYPTTSDLQDWATTRATLRGEAIAFAVAL